MGSRKQVWAHSLSETVRAAELGKTAQVVGIVGRQHPGISPTRVLPYDPEMGLSKDDGNADRYSLDGFSVVLPQGWSNLTEEGSGATTVGRTDGVGILQFSVGLYQRGPLPEVSLDDLAKMLADFSLKRQLGPGSDSLARQHPLRVIGMSYSTSGRFVRVWYVSDGLNVALVTYNCSSDDVGAEVMECEDVVDSLRFDVEKPH